MTFYVDHYTHKEKDYHVLTYQDVKSGLPSHVDFISLRGDVCHAKVTTIKTWKRHPEIEVHLKYGLYEYGITTVYPDNHYQGVELVKEL